MTKTNFTPGPWYFKSPIIGYFDIRTDIGEEDFYHICQIAPGANLANAHLIANAPNLYQALEQLLSETLDALGMLDFNPNDVLEDQEVIILARQALAKARGEED